MPNFIAHLLGVSALPETFTPFLLGDNVSFSFAEFDNSVEFIGQGLSSLKPGDRVLIAVDRSWKSLALMFAVIRVGAIAIPIDCNLPKARVTLLQSTFAIRHYVDARTHLENDAYRPSATSSLRAIDRFDQNEPCLGIFTSGSTGTPKLVYHGWCNLKTQADACNQLIPLNAGDRTLSSLPFYHIAGFAQVIRALLSSSTLVLSGVVEDAENLRRWAITHTSLVSTQLQRLLVCNGSVDSLKAVLIGGGPSDPEVIAQAQQRGYPLWLTYGMTETASQLITLSPSGRCSVINGNTLKLSGSGELLVRGSNLFLGYWSEGRLNDGRDEDGWFHTRDCAVVNKGHWVITGRTDSQYISGGKNIQPEEIEHALRELHSIETAVVVPVPHSEFGNASFALVCLRGREKLDDAFIQGIIRELKLTLPRYLVPRQYALLPNGEGASQGQKFNRKALRRLALSIQQERLL
ncbi:AMP-binding protein [Teredinibacter purpureus]|uniref:AMP-binding protein n=1 Tax=Teredinibacter purpureus TaxID=2731756 RepID=UPI0006986337|nr:AMP-binding protein [Teredinibacter purpureus]